MIRKNKKLIIILSGLGLFGIFLSYNFSSLKTHYYQLSKKNGIVAKEIKGRRIEYEYRQGYLYGAQSFINGQVDGWAYRYYKNGRVDRKLFVNNKTNYYKEFAFSPNGEPIYIGNYFHLKRYGNWNFYKKGHLNTYQAYDVDGKSFFTIPYNVKGNPDPVDQSGLIVSEKIFSIDKENNIVRLDGAPISLSRATKDLYLTIASPHQTKLYVAIKINGINYKINEIINSTVLLKDVFLKTGTYNIFIETHLYHKNNSVLNGINMEMRVTID